MQAPVATIAVLTSYGPGGEGQAGAMRKHLDAAAKHTDDPAILACARRWAGDADQLQQMAGDGKQQTKEVFENFRDSARSAGLNDGGAPAIRQYRRAVELRPDMSDMVAAELCAYALKLRIKKGTFKEWIGFTVERPGMIEAAREMTSKARRFNTKAVEGWKFKFKVEIGAEERYYHLEENPRDRLVFYLVEVFGNDPGFAAPYFNGTYSGGKPTPKGTAGKRYRNLNY